MAGTSLAPPSQLSQLLTPPRPGTTVRDPTRPTDGHLGAFVAATLGRPWTPHQRYVADVAGELLPSGRYAYPIVVMEEPRQVGKTVRVFDIALGRCIAYRDYRCAYTAQTGHIVTERYGDRFEELEASPLLLPRLKLRRSQGTERISVKATHSYVKAFPPKDGALRSSALDLVLVDESQEHSDVLGAALDRTIIPTQTTRPRRQLWVFGTAGTDASGYFRRYVDAAKAGTPGYAYFSFGAPEGTDPDDEAAWPSWHPGLAYGLTDTDALRTARSTLGQAGFAREYATLWTRSAVHVIDPELWKTARATGDMPPGRVAIGVDVSADRSGGAIVVAHPVGYVEVVEADHPLDELAPRTAALARKWGAPVAVDNVGPSATVRDQLEREYPDVELLDSSAGAVAIAAQGFTDKLAAHALTIRPHPALDAAVAVAAKRTLGDAGWAWSRRGSTGTIAPLVAASGAVWAAERLPAPAPQPAAYAE